MSRSDMRVLHVVPSFMPAVRYGGPIVSVLRLCMELSRAGVSVHVATTNMDGPGDLPIDTEKWVDVEGVPVRYFRRWPRIGYAPSLDLTRFLLSKTREFSLVHITSTFSYPAITAGAAARRAGRPYVVSPRGSLQMWSLRQKRWKKMPYWWALERRNLMQAAAIHATAGIEAEEVRLALPRVKVFTVPNGMEAIEPPSVARVPRRIVFLGRLHRKKGFDILVPALRLIANALPGVETIVAGPDDTGEWSRVERMVGAASPHPNIRWIGPVTGEEKWRLLASARAFVLPSHSENFGMSVVEALACGTPVVVSRNCPWRQVESEGAGFWVENTPERVAEALLRILRTPEADDRMGNAARRLARQYQWRTVGERMAEEYERITCEYAAAGNAHP